MFDIKTLQELDFIYGLSLLGFYLLAIRNTWHIIISEMNPSAAITWILINLSFPFLGVPLYLILGQSKLNRYTRLRRGKGLPAIQYPAPSILSHIEPFTSGQEAFPKIFDDIGMAQNFILVQYYIFRTDRLGLEFINHLIRKSQAGIPVFFIYDNLGSLGLTGRHTRRMKAAGIQVARFLPLSFRFNFQINFRNHRKTIIIDGRVAYIGGMNVGMEYLGIQRHWRDTQLRLQGEASHQLIGSFADDWAFAASKHQQSKLTQSLEGLTPLICGTMKSQIYSFGPGDPEPLGLYLFMDLIQSAKSKIFIATPYFIPDLVLERCLELALQKKVQIDMLVPYKSDSTIINIMNRYYCKRLQGRGARVYLYQAGFMHQKLLMIDEQKVLIGTSNFDNRSIYLNFETSILVEDESFTQVIQDMLQKDLQQSQLLNHKEMKPIERVFASLLRLASPLF